MIKDKHVKPVEVRTIKNENETLSWSIYFNVTVYFGPSLFTGLLMIKIITYEKSIVWYYKSLLLRYSLITSLRSLLIKAIPTLFLMKIYICVPEDNELL